MASFHISVKTGLATTKEYEVREIRGKVGRVKTWLAEREADDDDQARFLQFLQLIPQVH